MWSRGTDRFRDGCKMDVAGHRELSDERGPQSSQEDTLIKKKKHSWNSEMGSKSHSKSRPKPTILSSKFNNAMGCDLQTEERGTEKYLLYMNE